MNWRLPRYGTLAAIFVLLPTIAFGNGLGINLLTILLGAIACVTLLTVAILEIRRQIVATLLMLVAFVALFLGLIRISDDVHTILRWVIQKNAYKAEVLGQQAPGNGCLKHVEWDGWGYPGVGDTVIYLVFDPNDTLASAASTGSPGKFGGLPCEVRRVHRLERRWYTVLFYTETDWEHCN